MLWEKINKLKTSHKYTLAILLFSLLFFASRLLFINYDTINPDGVNWHNRSQQFINGIKYFQFDKTYQHYHPGVTLMWVAGVAIDITKFVINQEVYDHINFIIFDTVAKVSVISVQYILTLLAIFLLSKVIGFYKSLAVVFLFTFETFFVGNSRLLHLDSLVSLFIFNSLILYYLYLNDIKLFNFKYYSHVLALITGLFFALSFLTKSIAIGLVPFALLISIFYYFNNKNSKAFYKFGLVLVNFVSFVFILFPALWIDPIYYLTEIFSEGERVGIRKGHDQIIFGETTADGGLLFYPLVLLLKVTPFSLLFILMGFISYVKSKFTNKISIKKELLTFNWFILIFYMGYLLVMFYPTKKIDRYLVVMYPFIAYFTFVSIEYLFNKYKNIKSALLNMVGILFILLYFLPLIQFYPYYFTYFSPLFINAENAHKVIAQKPFGIGMYQLRDTIINDYGYVDLGFIDVKPIESIYPASKVFDIRVMDTSNYDILVLGPNEEFPQEVTDSDQKFLLDQIVKINGLDYWRIYVKSIN